MNPTGSLDGKSGLSLSGSDADARVKFQSKLTIKGMIPDDVIQNWKGPVDKITISVEAERILKNGTFRNDDKNENIVSKTEVNVSGLSYDDIPIDPNASEDDKMFNSKYREGILEFARNEREYGQKSMDSVKKTLGIPKEIGYSMHGAANVAIDEIARENGIEKPKPSQFLIDSGWKNPILDGAESATGTLTLNVPNTKKTMTVVFDKNSKVSQENLSLISLRSSNNQDASLVGKILDSPLGKSTDLRREIGASLYAVTDGGKGQNARVAATIRSVGMDDFATSSGLSLLKTLMRYVPGKTASVAGAD